VLKAILALVPPPEIALIGRQAPRLSRTPGKAPEKATWRQKRRARAKPVPGIAVADHVAIRHP
jgi:hypothetical protein